MHKTLHAASRGGACQRRGGFCFVVRLAVPGSPVRPIRQMNDDVDAAEMPGPVGARSDVADCG